MGAVHAALCRLKKSRQCRMAMLIPGVCRSGLEVAELSCGVAA